MAHATRMWLIALLTLITASTSFARDRFQIDIETSVIHWSGSKATGSHKGTLKIKSGSVEIHDGTLTALYLNFDMTTIESREKMPAAWKKKLENHLMSADFFHVAKFPVATYRLSNSTANKELNLSKGVLTLKNIGQEIPASIRIKKQGETFVLESNLTIDRTRWGVTHKSKKLLDSKAMIDGFIHDEIEISGILVARPQPAVEKNLTAHK